MRKEYNMKPIAKTMDNAINQLDEITEQFKEEWNPNLFALIKMDETEFFKALTQFVDSIKESCAKIAESIGTPDMSISHEQGFGGVWGKTIAKEIRKTKTRQ